MLCKYIWKYFWGKNNAALGSHEGIAERMNQTTPACSRSIHSVYHSNEYQSVCTMYPICHSEIRQNLVLVAIWNGMRDLHDC